MEKIRTTRTEYIEKLVEIDLYITSDGKEYELEKEAKAHEERLGVTSLGLNNYIPESLSVHYVRNMDELRSLVLDDYENKLNDIEQISDTMLPGWIGIKSIDYYGYGDEHFYYDIAQLTEAVDKTNESYKSILEKMSQSIE